MALEKSLLNFPLGNKSGAIFLIDALVALFLVVIILFTVLFFFWRINESPYSKLQAGRIANDLFVLFDRSGLLKDFNIQKIQEELDALLPPGYRMDFKIDCENRVYDSRNVLAYSYLFAGERVFISKNYTPCNVRYWIWND